VSNSGQDPIIWEWGWRWKRARSIDRVYHVDGLNIESVSMSNSGQDPVIWEREEEEEEGMVN